MTPARAAYWSNVLLLCIVLFPGSVTAQTAGARTAPSRLRVFLDCRFECDTEYLRQNIDFIDYVRDRGTFDVHVLVTTEGTGGGGTSWIVKFIGLDYFQNHDHTLAFNTLETATGDDRRKEFARIFKIGLVSYAAETDVASNLDVSIKPFERNDPTDRPSRDPWNYWVFRLGAGGDLNGERSSNNRSYRVNFSASRVTEQWKINVSLYGDTSQSSFKVTDDFR